MDVRQFKMKEERFGIPALIAFCLVLLELVLRNTLFKNLT